VIIQDLGIKLDIGRVKTGNNMTNSDIIEEILLESHALHIADDVMELGTQLRVKNPKLDLATALYTAFQTLTIKNNKN
jgi:hypothetical protein